MKNFLKNIGLLLTFYSISLAQIDTTLKEYFPMEIGNVWEYEEDMFPDYWHYQIKITRDTIMPNGKKYLEYFNNGDPFYTKYYRMDDSLNVYQYKKFVCLEASEYIRFKLTAKDSMSWLYCISTDTHYVTLITTKVVYYFNFGGSYKTKFYNEGTIRGWDNMAIRLAKGLGDVFSIFKVLHKS